MVVSKRGLVFQEFRLGFKGLGVRCFGFRGSGFRGSGFKGFGSRVRIYSIYSKLLYGDFQELGL